MPVATLSLYFRVVAFGSDDLLDDAGAVPVVVAGGEYAVHGLRVDLDCVVHVRRFDRHLRPTCFSPCTQIVPYTILDQVMICSRISRDTCSYLTEAFSSNL